MPPPESEPSDMKTPLLAVPLVAATLMAVPATPSFAQPATAPAAMGQVVLQWDVPPSDFRDAARRGFHDGIEAAHRDFYQHRRMDPDDNFMFRRPPVPRRERDEYRRGFERGYHAALNHRGDWDRRHWEWNDHDHDHDHGWDHH